MIVKSHQAIKCILRLNKKECILFRSPRADHLARSIHTSESNRVIHQLGKFKRFNKQDHYQLEPHVLNNAFTESGAIREMPKWLKFGPLKVVINIVIFILIGSFITKKVVTILEEKDIFKPEDDDDDDDDD